MRSRLRPRGVALSIALAATACQHRQPAIQPQPQPHYQLGSAWQGAAGAWFYPKEALNYSATGLAVVDGEQGHRLTADGERYDPALVAAAHQTLQLPSLLEVTDLENGRSLLVRVNDRGPVDQGRILSLTPQAARLLGIQPNRPARVRIELQGDMSRALADTVQGSPSLRITAAPVEAVEEQSLPAPGSPTPLSSRTLPPQAALSPSGPVNATAAMPSPHVVLGVADPGMLWIDAGQFSRRAYADQVSAATGGTVTSQGEGRQITYTVRVGPLQTTSDADAALDQARHAGVTGARIIVE